MSVLAKAIQVISMLLGVRYQKFKKYDDVTLDLSKRVTILVGPNSSGKSSLLKGLLAFKQTFEDQTDHAGFLSRGNYVDIGPFEEYVRDHVTKDTITFVFQLNVSVLGRASWDLSNSVFLEITHGEDTQTKHGRVQQYNIYLSTNNNKFNIHNYLDSPYCIKYERMQKSDESYKIDFSHAIMVELRKRYPRKTSEEYVVPDSWRQILKRGGIQATRNNERGMLTTFMRGGDFELFQMVNMMERLIVNPIHADLYESLTGNLYALAALRDKPQRSLPRTDERRVVGASGQNTASVYFDLRHRAVKAGKRSAKISSDFDRMNGWFKEIKLGNNLIISSWRDLIDFRTSVSEGAASDSIVDIGVGFSQAAPILVQLGAMQDESMLLIEQPELHLYPWAQTKLGEILCQEAQRGRKRLVLETHSEHIISGIQLHVSRGNLKGSECLSASDVQILYVDQRGSVQQLHISEDGELTTEWPEGFFDQTIKVYREILRNKQVK